MRIVRENPWRAATIVGIVLVAVGALLVVRGSRPQVIAWFGAPSLADTIFSPGIQMLSTQLLWGLGVGAAGLVVLAVCVAYDLGLRRGRCEGLAGRVPPSGRD